MTRRINLPRDLSRAGLPHYSGAITSIRAMWIWNAVLLLPFAWGVLAFGSRGLLQMIVSLSSVIVAEAIAVLLVFPAPSFPSKFRESLADGSSILSGSLIALLLPVTVHPAVPALAGFFAVLVIKWSFGGFGSNWLHPAVAGTLFVQISWPAGFAYGDWGRSLISGIGWNPGGYRAAGDLVLLKMRLMENGSPAVLRPLQFLGFQGSTADELLLRFLNDRIFVPLGSIIPEGYIDYLIGFRYGALGSTSVLLILLASVMLFARGIISWQIPLSGVLSMGLLSFLFAGVHWGADVFGGDVLFALSSGSFLFILFFVASDPVTTPYTSRGKLIFGAGFGALAFLLREFTMLSDGSAAALLLMNLANPLIIMISRRRPFGFHRFAAQQGGKR